MMLNKNKVLTLVLMLLTLMGQALASVAAPCAMEIDVSSTLMAEHQGHEMMMDNTPLADSHNSCESDCPCPPSGCNTLVFITATQHVAGLYLMDASPSTLLLNHSLFTASSLYRPPAHS